MKRHLSSLQSDGGLFLAAESIDYDYLTPFLQSANVTLMNSQRNMVKLVDVMNNETHVTIPKAMVVVVPEALSRVLSSNEMVYSLLKTENMENLAVVLKAVEHTA